MNIDIEHQNQPDSSTCTSACIAMITKIPVDDIVANFHPEYRRHRLTPYDYLKSRGFTVKRLYADERPVPGSLYLATVSSLNKEATLHHVLVDLREDGVVYDPNKYLEGKKYYIDWNTELSNNGLEVHLRSFVPEVEIITSTSW